MRWLVFATALLANPQNIYLQGQSVYFGDGDGVGGSAKWFPNQNALTVGIPVDNPYTGRGFVVGMCAKSTGCDGDYTHMASGLQILDAGDIGLLGASANLANINTVDSANNDTTFMIGGGATNKRGAAIQLYNTGKFGGDTFDLKASANEQSLLHISSGVNQTGSASYSLILGEVHETTTGSGTHRLLSLGTNSNVPNAMVGSAVGSGTDAAGYTPKFVVDSSGNIGVQTGIPTHALTLAQNSQWSSYNTAVDPVNYERAVGFWTSNIYVIQAQKGGTGTTRQIEVVTNDGSGMLYTDGGLLQLRGNTGGYTNVQELDDAVGINFDGKIQAANQANVRIRNAASANGYTSSTGTQQMLQVIGTVAQTGSGGYAGVEVNVTESTVGSGQHFLYSGIAAGASKFSVDSNGVIATAGTTTGTNQVGAIYPGSVAFSSLSGSATNGQIVYCNNCTIANPCATGGSGALAKRLNGVWVCN